MNTYHELAEAMRKGAALRPQISGGLFGMTDDGYFLGSCALGAAYEGKTGTTGLEDTDQSLGHIWQLFGLPGWDLVALPTGDVSSDVLNAIVDLNDTHGWTREAIANWLDTL